MTLNLVHQPPKFSLQIFNGSPLIICQLCPRVDSPSKCVDPVLLLELATPETHWAETSQIEPMVDPVLLVALEIGSAVTADVAVEIASAVPEAVVAEDSVYSAVPAAAGAVCVCA